MTAPARSARAQQRLGVRTLLIAGMAFGACAPVESDGLRRQHLLGRDVTDRAFVSVRWSKSLVQHRIFTYAPEEFAGPGASRDGKRVYVGTSTGQLWALDAARGRRLWVTDLGAPITSAPLVVPALGLLYVGAGDGAVHALSTETGAPRWRYQTKGIAYHRPVYEDGVVYFSNHRDQVFSLNARTGKWRWSYDRETPEKMTVAGHAGVAVSAGRLYAGFSDGSLVCLGARGGEVRWMRRLGEGDTEAHDVDTTPVIRRGIVYAASVSTGVYALTAEGGALQWRSPLRGVVGITVAGDRVYLASAREGIVALDRDGRHRWAHRLVLGSPRAPVIRERMLAVSFAEGGLVLLDRRTGALVQRFNPGGGVSGPLLLTRTSLFLLSNRGRFFALTLL